MFHCILNKLHLCVLNFYQLVGTFWGSLYWPYGLTHLIFLLSEISTRPLFSPLSWSSNNTPFSPFSCKLRFVLWDSLVISVYWKIFIILGSSQLLFLLHNHWDMYILQFYHYYTVCVFDLLFLGTSKFLKCKNQILLF